jgi:murein DD-endopeptidase MepM/ murein hydrolase activator NlpD
MIRVALAGVIGTFAASCSSDALRFSDNPFSSPFGGRSADATPPVPALPAGKVQSHALPPPGQHANAGSLAEPDRSIATSSIRPGAAQPVKPSGVGSWSTTGGTAMTVAQGDTIAALSSRYGVPESALRSANNIGPHADPTPGSQIVIPVYRYGQAGGAPPKAVAAAKIEASRKAEAAKKPETQSPRVAANASPAPTKPKGVGPAPAQPQPSKPKEMAKVESPDDVDASLPTSTVKSDAPQFRWPARGRVISRFGGDGNDGINIAVPEGTSVRAAEDGTVAYVGDEIKGYGKLVLVRHANGWVSAYANNADLMVKKGEVVKRGQILAKSGQSGNVTSPQLHFELRRGKTPVDPQEYLAGG